MKPCDHKITVPISAEMHARLQKIFPWGTLSEAIRRLLELLLTSVEKNGYNTIQRLISGTYDPLEGLPKINSQPKTEREKKV